MRELSSGARLRGAQDGGPGSQVITISRRGTLELPARVDPRSAPWMLSGRLAAWGSARGLPVGLLFGPVPNKRELDALAIRRTDHTPKPYEENKQRHQTNKTEQNTGPKERGVPQDKEQDVSKENCVNVEYERLPCVEAHIRSLVVAPDGQKEDRKQGSEVGECGDRIVRKAGFGGIGFHLSLSGSGTSTKDQVEHSGPIS